MNPDKISQLSSELTGIWGSRTQSKYSLNLWLIFRLCTAIIFLILLIKVIEDVGLVTVATMLISGTIIIVLEVYSKKFPSIIIPLSQFIILISVGYLHLYILFSQQAVIFEAIYYSIFPDILELFLGLILFIRIILGMEIIRITRIYRNAQIPLSKYPYDNLKHFMTNLQLTEKKLADEFLEESVFFRLRSFFYSISISIILFLFLLLPLWLSLLGYKNFYPYILLIPTILASLFLLFYSSPKNE